MEKRNTILLTVIAIATLLVAVVGATFAFFASNINTNANIGANITTANNQATFIASTTGSVNFTVDAYEMQEADSTDDGNQSTNTDYIEGLTGNATLNVTLLSPVEGQEITCSYDIIYTWNGDDQNFTEVPEATGKNYYPSKYYVRSNQEELESFKEFTVEADLSAGVENEEGQTPGTAASIIETNIDEFTPKTGTEDNKVLVLKTGTTITSDSPTNKSYHTYEFTFRFYNLHKDQSTLMGKKFFGSVSVDNVHC